MNRFATCALAIFLAGPPFGCSKKQLGDSETRASATAPVAGPAGRVEAQASATEEVSPHAEHDCSQHSSPAPKFVPAPEVVQLGEKTLAKLESIRISSRLGGVSLVRTSDAWKVTDREGCTPDPARVERLFGNLAELKASPVKQQLDIGAFELQIRGEGERQSLYRLDVAARSQQGDLVQLARGTRRWVRGLDRNLVSPRFQDWCAHRD